MAASHHRPRWVNDNGYATVAQNIIRAQEQRVQRNDIQYVTANKLRTSDIIVTTDGNRFTLLSTATLEDGRIHLRPWSGTGFTVPAKTRFARVRRRADTKPNP